MGEEKLGNVSGESELLANFFFPEKGSEGVANKWLRSILTHFMIAPPKKKLAEALPYFLFDYSKGFEVLLMLR